MARKFHALLVGDHGFVADITFQVDAPDDQQAAAEDRAEDFAQMLASGAGPVEVDAVYEIG